MTLLTPHPIKRIYGLGDLHEHPEESRVTALEDDWDNRQGLVLWLTDSDKGASVWGDRSGAGNHGTVYGATAPPAATPSALGYAFDGTDDYIVTPGCAIPNTSGIITFVFYGSTAQKATQQAFLSHGEAVSGTLYIRRPANSNDLIFEYSNGVSSFKTTTATNHFVGFDSKWIKTAIIADYNNMTVSFYRNGQLFVSNAVGETMVYPNNSLPIYVGAYNTSTGFLLGSINDVRIYNRALPPGEITSYFQHTRGKYGV